VRSSEHGYGIPVAFLITRSTDEAVFQEWFSGLTAKMAEVHGITYVPEVVITDQGSVEILAIRTAFPRARIHYCAWHVIRAWNHMLINVNLGIEHLSYKEKVNARENVSVSGTKMSKSLNVSDASKCLRRV
jgi:hypothetical protein